MALVLVTSAALVSVLFLQRGLAQWKNQSSSSAQKGAFYLAEAGIAEAIDALRAGSSGNVGTQAAPAVFGDGGFWVEAVTDADGVVHLTSTGLLSGHAFRLDQAVAYPQLPLSSEGFFGATEVLIGDGAVVRFADEVGGAGGGVVNDIVGGLGSGLGGLLGGGVDPGEQNGNGNGNGKDKDKDKDKDRIALPVAPVVQAPGRPLVSSNGSIELGLGSVVEGILTPGPGGLVANLLDALLGGATTPAPELRPLPEIAMPIVADPLDAVFTNGELEIEGGAVGYGPIVVGAGETLRLVGPLALAAPCLEVADGGLVEVDTSDGEVQVFLDSHLLVAEEAAVANTSGDPSRLAFLVDGRTSPDADGDGRSESAVVWRSSWPVQAALYAPHATVTVPAGSTWRGALTAQSLVVEDGAVLELDPAVDALDLRGRDLVALSWRPVPIPPGERAELARDPIATASRSGTPLPAAAAARIPATNSYRFTDDQGNLLTYLGDALGDLTTATVDTVLPAQVEAADAAPEFQDTERSGCDEDDSTDAGKSFKNAWKLAKEALDDAWLSALESGKIPADAWQSVVVDGVPVEPIHTVFGDPLVRDPIDAYLESSRHQDTTIEFLRASLDLMP